MDLRDYYAQAEEARKTCSKNGITEDNDVESMYFVSTVPWLRYTALVQPVGGEESNPRMTWGKYEENDKGRIIMPVSIMVHHAIADGIHIAQFFKNLENKIQEFESMI